MKPVSIVEVLSFLIACFTENLGKPSVYQKKSVLQ